MFLQFDIFFRFRYKYIDNKYKTNIKLLHEYQLFDNGYLTLETLAYAIENTFVANQHKSIRVRVFSFW